MTSTSYYLNAKRKPQYKSVYVTPQMVNASFTIHTTSSAVSAASYHCAGAGASGRFTTHVQNLNSGGHAVAPGPRCAPNLRRVIGDGDDDDRYQYEEPNQNSNIAPVGDTPWALLGILAVVYVFAKRRSKSKIVNFPLLSERGRG